MLTWLIIHHNIYHHSTVFCRIIWISKVTCWSYLIYVCSGLRSAIHLDQVKSSRKWRGEERIKKLNVKCWTTHVETTRGLRSLYDSSTPVQLYRHCLPHFKDDSSSRWITRHKAFLQTKKTWRLSFNTSEAEIKEGKTLPIY